MKRARFPMRIRRGSSVVSIYQTPKHRYASFTVAHYDAAGRRCRKTFSSLKRAIAAATQVTETLASGKADFLTLTGPELLIYRRACSALERTGISLDIAAAEYAEAKHALGITALNSAVQAYITDRTSTVEPKLLGDVVKELLASKIEKGRSELYQRDLRIRLERVAATFPGPLCALSPKEIDEFLASLKVSARTRNNFRGVIGTLIRFGQQRGYVALDHPGVRVVEKATAKPAEVRTFTPEEFRILLENAKPDLIPALVIGAFAGVRSEEIKRLRWEDIKLSQGHIEIKSANSKTKTRRLIPLQKNLRVWLKLHAEAEGPVTPYANLALQYAKLARRTGVGWVRNGLRHSFVSYRTAHQKNLASVALEAGNTPHVISRHYLKVVTSAEARKWFNIFPSDPNRAAVRARRQHARRG